MKVPIFTDEKIPNLEKCVLAYGHFNSVHPGHVRYLKKAASEGHSLIVAILPDTDKGQKRQYKFAQLERAEGLTALNIIDGIILLKDEEFYLSKVIKKLKPSALFLGIEFEDENNFNFHYTRFLKYPEGDSVRTIPYQSQWSKIN